MLGYFNIIAIFGHPVSMYRISRLIYLFFFSFSVITFSSFSQTYGVHTSAENTNLGAIDSI